MTDNIYTKMEHRLDEVLRDAPDNEVIQGAFRKANEVVNHPQYGKALVSISGGSDSDIMLDILTRIDIENKCDYVFFDTGIEWDATKEHLQYLENRYNIEIRKVRPKYPVPLAISRKGQPFLSKRTSENIYRLQKHNFKFEDKPLEELLSEYDNCISAIRWWCNDFGKERNKIGRFDIDHNHYLKEFLIENPPATKEEVEKGIGFMISDKCCELAKKNLAQTLIKKENYGLNIIGLRRAEGGARQTTYNGCFSVSAKLISYYRPLWWFTDADKEEYEKHYGIVHSRCYTEYGLKRTGCAGCPFGLEYKFELEKLKEYEPKRYAAVIKIFKESYEMTDKYKAFAKEKKLQTSARKREARKAQRAKEGNGN